MLTVAERSERLETEIRRYVGEGFTLQSRTETSARLIRAKQFNPAVLWASVLLIGIGVFIFIAYYMYYLGKRDLVIEIAIDAEGNVIERDLSADDYQAERDAPHDRRINAGRPTAAEVRREERSSLTGQCEPVRSKRAC
jgi:hypothetical protein